MGNQVSGVPRITQNDILAGISKRTNFTKTEINEMFFAYREILDEMAESNNRPIDLEFSLPHIGYFKFKRYKARKVSGRLRAVSRVDENNKKVYEDVDLTNKVVGEYDRLIFRVDKKLAQEIRLKSRERIQRNKEKRKQFE